MTGSERICAALDFGSLGEAEAFARTVLPHVGMLKVGLELFAAEGARVTIAEMSPIWPIQSTAVAYLCTPSS